ncbi:MAG: LPS export ABC transporter periplasmic protein LptC [Thiotrichales bacterium]|nr:MAG: LPS export ABC transporter periplasmic protein LptC [Thiotrichales bacterium]
MRKKVIITALIVLIIFIAVLTATNSKPTTTTEAPQEYMLNVALLQFNTNGRMQRKLTAKKWSYFHSKQQSYLEQPKLTVYKDNGSIWHLHSDNSTAKQTSIAQKPEYFLLRNNVVMQRMAAINIMPVKFSTSEAYFYPETELLTSSKQVRMEKPGTVISGRGLRSYMNRQYAELLENVKTTYVRDQNKS